jgi:hypothetical protein
VSSAQARRAVPVSVRRMRWERLWPWLPLLFAGVYFVVLLATLRSVVQSIYWSSDVVSAPYIGELYPSRGSGAHVVLGNIPWYTTLWFEELTRWLPAHREIWEGAPWLFSLFGVGLVAWSAGKAAGRWAAMVVAVALACAGPGLLSYQFALSIHAATFVHVCILGAFIVLCASRGGQVRGRYAHVALSAAIGAVTAAGVASDRLLVVAGLAPFLLTGLALAWLLGPPARRRLALSAVGVTVLALVGGRVIAAIMEASNVRAAHFDITFAQWDHLVPNLRLLAQGLAYLFNGDFGGARFNGRGLLAFACALALAAAAYAAVRFGRRWVTEAIARRRRREENGPPPALAAHVVFWSSAAVLLALAYVFSSVPIDRYTSRYLLTVGYGIAALVPLAATIRYAWARAAVVAGVCVIVTGSIAALARRDLQDQAPGFPTPALSGPLLRLAHQYGATVGYANYWDAAPLTWQMKSDVRVYPVRSCASGAGVCPFGLHRISTWYLPRPGRRSFLVVDPRFPNGPQDPGPALGRPIRVAAIPPARVYVYDDDIAARFGH